MPPSLGLIGAGGAAAASQALRLIEEDKLRRRLLQEQQDLAVRRQGEVERSNRAGEGQFDIMAPSIIDLRKVQTSDIARRPQAEADARTHDVDLLTRRNEFVAGQSAFDRAHDVDLLTRRNEFVAGQGELGRAHDIGMLTRSGDQATNLQRLRGQQELQQINTAAQERIRAQSAATQAGAANIDALADMVSKNPDLLEKLSTSDRSQVLKHMAATNTDMPNRRNDTLKEVVSGAEDALKVLEEGAKTGRGFAGAVGAPSIETLFGYLDQPMAGTSAAGYVEQIKALKSRLTQPRLEMMRGLGAMSNIEFENMMSSVTALNPRMSESDFKTELGKIRQHLGVIKQRIGMTDAGGRVRVQGPNGQTGTIDASEVSSLGPGWKVIGG